MIEFEVDVPHGLKVSGASLGGSKVVSLRSGGVTFNKNETVWRPLQLVCAELIGELTIKLEQDFKWPEDLAPKYRWLHMTPAGNWYFDKEKPSLQHTGWRVFNDSFRADALKSFVPPQCDDWRQSLRERPEA